MPDSLTIFGTSYTNVKGFKAKDGSSNTLAYIRPQGTKTITENGSNIDVSEYAAVTVSVSGGGSGGGITVVETQDEHGGTVVDITGEAVTVTLQDKTVTPTTSQQTIEADSGYTGLDTVTVNAIPSQYIVPTGTKSITANGTGIDVTEYAAVDVSVSGGGSPTLQTKTKNYTPTESQQTEAVTADSGYDGLDAVNVTVGAISSSYVGSGITRRSSSDLTASGATVSVPSGYYENAASKSVASGTEGTPTATKGTVSNHSVSVTPSVTNTAGYISGGTKTGTAVTVSASELVSGSETKTTNDTYDVTNLASLVVNVPTGTARTSSDVTVSGDTVSIPAGLYSSAVSKSVASGTAGTPTATKGTVSNHSVSVTPSVTNTTGYITGGTKTGTGVSVSASELVSGSETKTANGTYDVTNLASLVVNIPIVTYYTGSSAPSSSLGSDGDIYLQTS